MRRTRTRHRFAAATMAGAALVGGLAAGPAARAQTVSGEVRFGENYRQGTDPAPSRGRDVPGLAVDPADPMHVVSVDVDYLNGQCSFKTSFDGGVTWPNGGNLTAPPEWTDPPCYQNFDSGGYAHGNASVVFGAGNNVYTAFSSHRGPYQRPESLIIAGNGDDSLVARSTDGGRTFGRAVPAVLGSLPQPFNIRPQVAVQRGAGDAGQDRVYVGVWRCRVISSGCSGGDDVRELWMARSDDAGQTWLPAVRVTGPTGGPANNPSLNLNPPSPGTEQVNEPSQPVVDPRNGWVYVAYHRRDSNPVVSNVEIARSIDMGQTWSRFTAGPGNVIVNAPPSLASIGGNHPRLAVDPANGTLYIAYVDNRFAVLAGATVAAGDQDISFVKSTDGGATWSTPVRVNDDPVNNGFAQSAPRVEVAPNGRVDVVWFDRRNSSTLSTLGDIYYAYSSDAGSTFSANRRVTDRHLNTGVGLTGVGGYTWYGPTLAAKGNDQLLVAWTDSREGNFDNGGQDIYLSNLDLRSGSLPVRRMPAATPAGLAIAMSRLAYPGGSELNSAVAPGRPVIVSDSDPVLALAAVPLARANLAPLLLSPPARLSPDAKAEVLRMAPPGAYVVGSTGALGPGVVTALTEAQVPPETIVRLSGTSAADTAKQIALAMDFRTPAQKTANTTRAFPAVIVVNPASKEAAAAAGLAASMRVPILFTDQNSVPAPTTEAIAALNVNVTLVVGGGSVSDAVVASLPGAKRLGGGDPAGVSLAVAVEAKERRLPTNVVYVGDTEQPMDAALIATASGRNGGLLLLVPGAEPGKAESALVQIGLRPVVDRLVVARSTAGLGGPGYRLVARDGGIFAFGGAGFFGSTGGMKLAKPMVGMAATPTNRGYWTVGADGGVFAFGDARFKGSTGALRLAQPVVGLAPTPTGNGYWLVAKDGGVFAFGDAKFYGSTGAVGLNQPVVSMAATPSGKGYWLLAADGGIFAFGDAKFSGSAGGSRLARPAVALSPSPTGDGYWLVAADGGVFAFGDAAFKGSTGGSRLAQPIVSMDSSPSGKGYWLTAADGGVFAFGDAAFQGSTGGSRLAQPVVGMSAGR